MIRDHPLVGVGPNMVEPLYPQYRVADAVEKVDQHLHNVPLQIAAERGLPALAAWLSFVVILLVDLSRRFRVSETGFSPPPRSRPACRCSRPACSSTTSAIPNS